MMKILVYVLHGVWKSNDSEQSEVIEVSDNLEVLKKRLDEIAKSQAESYIGTHKNLLCYKKYELRYEVICLYDYAKFYITKHHLDLSQNIMVAVSREMEKIDRTNDVRAYIEMLYESESIEAWKYEYMTREPAVMQEILQVFSKTEDCNAPFNTTMDIVVGNVMKEIVLDDKKLEYLWEEFGDVLIDDDECILDDFLGFECGTHQEAVWHWFDERYSGGVAKLMFGGE